MAVTASPLGPAGHLRTPDIRVADQGAATTSARIDLSPSGRIAHLIQFALAVVLCLWICLIVSQISGALAMDYTAYRHIGLRVLDGGSLYQPQQVSGPYEVHGGWFGDGLYPPFTAALFVLFAAMPDPVAAFAWYAIPIAVTIWCFSRMRPTGWRLVVALACVAYPSSIGALLLGNPAMWALAAVSAGMVRGWAAAFVLIKPTLAPFLLVGARDRWTWVVAGAFVAISILTLPLTVEWVSALANARGQFSGLGHALSHVPLLLAPVAANWPRRAIAPSFRWPLRPEPAQAAESAR